MSSINPGHPATNPASRSSNVGNRVRGVTEFIHGAGENIRGTFLGAVDTIIKPESGVNKNDELAHQGRLSMERGLAKMKGQGVGNSDPQYGNRAGAWTDGQQQQQRPVGDDRFINGKGAGPGPGGEVAAPADAKRIGQQNRPMEMPTSNVQQSESETRGAYPAQQPQSHSTETQVQSHNDTGGLPYPGHHRDDAISGVSQGQMNEIKAVDERRGHGGGVQQNGNGGGGGGHSSSGPEVGALKDRGLPR